MNETKDQLEIQKKDNWLRYNGNDYYNKCKEIIRWANTKCVYEKGIINIIKNIPLVFREKAKYIIKEDDLKITVINRGYTYLVKVNGSIVFDGYDELILPGEWVASIDRIYNNVKSDLAKWDEKADYRRSESDLLELKIKMSGNDPVKLKEAKREFREFVEKEF